MNIHDRYGTKHNIWESVQNWIGGRESVYVNQDVPLLDPVLPEDDEPPDPSAEEPFLSSNYNVV